MSDSGPHHVRVEWGPLQAARVLRYTVEYGAIPSGHVHTVTLHPHENFIFLSGLEAATQYLVTVSAVCADGRERAMSVRACTQNGTFLRKVLLLPVNIFSIFYFFFLCSSGSRPTCPGGAAAQPSAASGSVAGDMAGPPAGPSRSTERLLADLGAR